MAMASSINTLDTDGYWMVDSSHIYVPHKCKVEHTNVVASDSGRDETGYLQIGWVRADVRKASLTYTWLTGDELSYMMDLMQGKEFTFKFLEDDAVRSISAYVGECNYEHYNYGNGTKVYKNFNINVIEK